MNAIEVSQKCHLNPICKNTNGGYNCSCKGGYSEMDIIAQVCFLSVYKSISYDILCREMDEIH